MNDYISVISGAYNLKRSTIRKVSDKQYFIDEQLNLLPLVYDGVTITFDQILIGTLINIRGEL